MHIRLLELLACPACRGELDCDVEARVSAGEILTGALRCRGCATAYPIVRGIPRFVAAENYAASFGYQWNRFRQEQIDSLNGTSKSAKRLKAETDWPEEWLRGKWALDAGCGAGRFLDVITQSRCEVVGVDLSDAVDAVQTNLGQRPNLHLIQASIFELPFKDGVFDACYCIGVLQHTPDPKVAIKALPRVLKPGGRLAVTIYERRRFTMLHGKYFARPLTRRLPYRVLATAVQLMMPIAFPVTEVLFRLPVVGRFFRFGIPIYNYVDDKDLSWRQRYRWAVLDTIDGLSPRFDQPQRESETREALESEGMIGIRRLPNPGLNLIATRSSPQTDRLDRSRQGVAKVS